jgi:tetratricopeptide (TPR) repeat protein|tara:strand:+ start:228 stop:1403 length:1176 start_codon:yes stop_codon:yes gene_type:complete
LGINWKQTIGRYFRKGGKMNRGALRVLLGLLVIGLLATGCASGPVIEGEPESELDTPEHHYDLGKYYLERGEMGKAEKEFKRSIELNPKFSLGYSGIGLVHTKNGEFDKAHESIKKAKKLAKSIDGKAIADVNYIRLYIDSKEEDWLKKAVKAFNRVKKVDPERSDIYLYTGLAYKKANKYDKATEKFSKVISLDKEYVARANKEWNDIQNRERAAPGTLNGENLSRIDRINRADLAALFVKEFRLDKIFKEKGVPISESNNPILNTPTDFEYHKLKADIEMVLSYRVRGLEMFAKGVFAPDKNITRASFAVMIEDILARINRENWIYRKFVGSVSPFYDVDNGYYAFNSIMTVSSRGIMSGDLEGNFRKESSVSGAEALLILRSLKERLR